MWSILRGLSVANIDLMRARLALRRFCQAAVWVTSQDSHRCVAIPISTYVSWKVVQNPPCFVGREVW